jgi:hypothetical protein
LFDVSASPTIALENKTVSFAVGNQVCTGVTNADGVATCTITPDMPGQFTVDASFDGTSTLLGATCSGTFSAFVPSCAPSPATGCQPAASQKASLLLAKGSTSKQSRITWKWTSTSSGVPLVDYGSPISSTTYALCVYDNQSLQMTAVVPAGGTCGTKPCWTTVGASGFKYSEKAGAADGITRVLLKAGTGGKKAKIQFKGKGDGLLIPPLSLATPLRVQVQRSGGTACWEATYSSATVTERHFKAKSD